MFTTAGSAFRTTCPTASRRAAGSSVKAGAVRARMTEAAPAACEGESAAGRCTSRGKAGRMGFRVSGRLSALEEAGDPILKRGVRAEYVHQGAAREGVYDVEMAHRGARGGGGNLARYLPEL